MARGNDVACREAGDTKSTLISASWPSYTLSSMQGRSNEKLQNKLLFGAENSGFYALILIFVMAI